MSVDDMFDRYAAELTTLIDKHAPRCINKRKKHILTPWFDDECTAFKCSARRLERKYKKTKDPDDRKEWIIRLKEQMKCFRWKEQIYWSNRIGLQFVIMKEIVAESGPSHEEN